MRDLLTGLARTAFLAVRRGEPALVRRDRQTGGWVHRYRSAVLVSATPRGSPWSHVERDTHEIWLHVHTPAPGDTVVEIGAESGTETVVLSRLVGPTGRVVAVEAHPATYALLLRTLELNGLANVTPVHAAVVDAPGTVRISDGGPEQSLANTVVVPGENAVEVRGTTLDEITDGLGAIDLLKVNIEGAEALVVRAMAGTAPRVRHAVFACHDFRADLGEGDGFRTADEVHRALLDLGLEVTRRTDDERPWVRDTLYARRP